MSLEKTAGRDWGILTASLALGIPPKSAASYSGAFEVAESVFRKKAHQPLKV